MINSIKNICIFSSISIKYYYFVDNHYLNQSMASFTEDTNDSAQVSKFKLYRNGALALIGLAVAYLAYQQYIQAQVQVSQIQLNSEEIKTINTDLGRLRDDIQDNRTGIQEKQQKIDELKAQLDAVKNEAKKQSEERQNAIVESLQKQISQLSAEKEQLQNRLNKTIGEYETKITSFQKIVKQKDSIIAGQRTTIGQLEVVLAQKQNEVKKLEFELNETNDVIESLEDKLHVTITDVSFYANGFDDTDDDLNSTKNKKNITELGIFYSLSREIKTNEKILVELSLPNQKIIGKKEFTNKDIDDIQKQAKQNGVERPLSIKIQKGSFDVPLKINFYVKVGSHKQRLFLIDSKLIPAIRTKKLL